MPIDLRLFWGDNYYRHPPLTDAMIAQAEVILKVQLPVELVNLLRIQNGGYTRGFAHPMTRPTTWAEDDVPLDELAGIAMDTTKNMMQNLLATDYMSNE
jgi:SMI1-KNR4 cell-wall